MDLIFLLQEKVQTLVKAYKEQSLQMEEMQLKLNDLAHSIAEKEELIHGLNEEIQQLQFKTSADHLDESEQKALKKQLNQLIKQIDIYVAQLK